MEMGKLPRKNGNASVLTQSFAQILLYIFSTASGELEESFLFLLSAPTYGQTEKFPQLRVCKDLLNAAETRWKLMGAQTPLLKIVFYHNQVKKQNQTCTLLSARTHCTKQKWPSRCSPLRHNTAFKWTPIPWPKPHVSCSSRLPGSQQHVTRLVKLLSHCENPLYNFPCWRA